LAYYCKKIKDSPQNELILACQPQFCFYTNKKKNQHTS
jgi:hypothetical protein